MRTVGVEFVVVATGGAVPPEATATLRPQQGSAGYASVSGQPASTRPPGTDTGNTGAGGAPDIPKSVLAVPCVHSGNVVAVLELANATQGRAASTTSRSRSPGPLGQVGGPTSPPRTSQRRTSERVSLDPMPCLYGGRDHYVAAVTRHDAELTEIGWVLERDGASLLAEYPPTSSGWAAQ